MPTSQGVLQKQSKSKAHAIHTAFDIAQFTQPVLPSLLRSFFLCSPPAVGTHGMPVTHPIYKQPAMSASVAAAATPSATAAHSTQGHALFLGSHAGGTQACQQ